MSDSAEELRAAQEMLYEDESLRSHLTDEQARPLLEWAARRLAATGGAGIEQAQEKVRAVLRLVDQAAAAEGGDPAAALSRLPALVRELPGAGPPPPLPAGLARIPMPRPETEGQEAVDPAAAADDAGPGLDLAGFARMEGGRPGGSASPEPSSAPASQPQRRRKTAWRSRRAHRFAGAARPKRPRGGSGA